MTFRLIGQALAMDHRYNAPQTASIAECSPPLQRFAEAASGSVQNPKPSPERELSCQLTMSVDLIA
jgi:hypothetical protein